MSSRKTSKARSHRSKRAYKPVNKAMCHKAAAERKSLHRFINTASSMYDRH